MKKFEHQLTSKIVSFIAVRLLFAVLLKSKIYGNNRLDIVDEIVQNNGEAVIENFLQGTKVCNRSLGSHFSDIIFRIYSEGI